MDINKLYNISCYDRKENISHCTYLYHCISRSLCEKAMSCEKRMSSQRRKCAERCATEIKVGHLNMNIFSILSILFIMKVCCVFLLESHHRGDSNEYTQYTIFNIKKKISLNYPKFAAMGFCSKGLENEFETAVVNEPSVFEPLKFYCIYTTQVACYCFS